MSYNVGEYNNREMSDVPIVPASMLPRGRLECLVAGTQVQTESGLKSVESIRLARYHVGRIMLEARIANNRATTGRYSRNVF